MSLVEQLLKRNLIGKDRNIKTINAILLVFASIFAGTGILSIVGGKTENIIFRVFNLLTLFIIVPLTFNLIKIIRSDGSNSLLRQKAKFSLTSLCALSILSFISLFNLLSYL